MIDRWGAHGERPSHTLAIGARIATTGRAQQLTKLPDQVHLERHHSWRQRQSYSVERKSAV